MPLTRSTVHKHQQRSYAKAAASACVYARALGRPEVRGNTVTFLRAQVRPTPRYGEPGGRAALVCRSERPINVSGTFVLIETHLCEGRSVGANCVDHCAETRHAHRRRVGLARYLPENARAPKAVRIGTKPLPPQNGVCRDAGQAATATN